MANKRKPAALKLLGGNDKPSRLYPEPEFPPASGTDRPDWLVGVEAVREWDRTAPLLLSARVLTEADLTALAHYCNLHGECVDLWRAGKGGPNAAQLTQLRLLAVEFGMTPASRSKAAQTDAAKDTNEFNRLTG